VDVTAVAFDRARLYQELEKLNGDLTDSNKQQVTLIHFITHQLKGFVAKSRNIFSMIQEGDYGEVPESMKPIVAEGFASSTKGAQTIQEILNAANIKSGQVAYSNAAFDFKASMNAIVASLKPNADAKGVALTIAEPDTEVMFTGDQMQMENAIKNLIDNSIKYTPQGSITVTLTKDAGTIRLVTEDTGVGITPEDMARLFTEGGHGAESQKVNVDSTGFGLYIVKNIVEGHKGKVWAESEGAGKGSKFIVELPAP
jgi:signal transduction histidine kinase